MNVALQSLRVSTTLLISLITTLPLTLNPLSISEVLAQAPTPTFEEQMLDGVYLNQQGRDDYEKGRPQEALSKFQQALVIFRRLKAQAGIANSLNNIGEVYYYSLGKSEQGKSICLVISAAVIDSTNCSIYYCSTEHGLLTAWEILNLNLNTDLVVLSACDTG